MLLAGKAGLTASKVAQAWINACDCMCFRSML